VPPSGRVAVSAVGMGGGDGPEVAVADGLTDAGGEPAVIAAGHDGFTDMSTFTTGDRDGAAGVKLAGVESGVLDGVVQCVDVLVVAGHDRHRPPPTRQLEPVGSDALEVLVEGAGLDAAVLLVHVDSGGLTGAQLQRRVGFPRVGEAVDSDQLVQAAGGAQLGEHPAPADRLELAGVTHEHQAPVQTIGEADELVQRAGPDHAGLVDHGGGGHGEPVAVVGEPVAPLPFVGELGNGLRLHPRLGEDVRGLRRRGDTEHEAAMASQVLNCRGEHGGLARPRGTDHHHKPIPAGDRRCRVGLEDVKPVPIDGG